MRIGMILGKPFPPDIRVEKEAKTLCSHGFSIGLLAKYNKNNTLKEGLKEYGLKIYRAEIPHESKWDSYVKGITLTERQWEKPLLDFISRFQPDVLHVHDLDLLKTTLHLANMYHLPVVADLHENMPAAYRVWRSNLKSINRFKNSIKHNYYILRWHEKRLLENCHKVIVVVPEAAERLYRFGIEKNKIVVVSNTEDETTFDITQPDSNILKCYNEYWVLSYVGGIGPHRGLDTVIRGLSLVCRQIPNIKLLLVGSKQDRHVAQISRLISELDVENKVEIIAWQPKEIIGSYILASAVGLVPHNDSEHTQTTVPHKLFQYMIAGKPVIVSNVRPLKRIIDDSKCGLVFTANDPHSLAQAVLKLYHQSELKQYLGNNGIKAVRGKYSWRYDAKRLIQLYIKLEQTI